MTYDVAIIGAGMAGATAALRARKKGLKVIVVSKGWGATAMSSGAIDFWDFSGRRVLPEQYILDLADNPFHPYHLIANENDFFSWEKLLETAQDAFNLMRPELEAEGLKLAGDVKESLTLSDEAGVPRPVNLAQESQVAANANQDRLKVLVIGLNGLFTDYDPDFLIKAWRLWSRRGLWPSWETASDTIDMAAFGGGQKRLTPLEAARLCDDAEAAAGLVQELRLKAQSHAAALVVLPPVFGIESTAFYLSSLRRVGVEACELLASPPSVPGHRVQAALDRLLKKKDVAFCRGEVVGFEAKGARLTGLTLKMGSRAEKIEADRVILATGKFAGGGLFAQAGFKESLFKLPVFFGDKEISVKPPFPLVDPRFERRQDIFAAGVKTDSELRPLNSNSRPAFENLRAAGAVLGGAHPIAGKCGLGLALLTGYAAAKD